MNDANEHHWSNRLAAWICTRPLVVLAIAAVLAAGAIALTASRLDFQSDRNALIDADIPWNRRYIDWWTQFPNQTDLLVIIDAGRPGTNVTNPGWQLEMAEHAEFELATILEASDAIESVFHGASTEAWSSKTARALPIDELRTELEHAAKSRPLLESDDVASFIAALATSIQEGLATKPALADEAAVVAALNEFQMTLEAIEAALVSGQQHNLAERFAPGTDMWQPLRSANQRFTFLRIKPRVRDGSLLAAEEAIAVIRRTIDIVAPRYEMYNIDIGLTGVEVIESDETTVAATDSAVASCIAVVLISILLVLSFRSVVVPLLLVIALLIGVAWSFGFLTISVGHLQVLSVVFVVILLGLGIDFGIHLVSALEHVRRNHPDAGGFTPALAHAYQRCGPGVIFGALTTAAAFFATTLTDFTGVAEMGIIACGGIVLCVIAMLTILPALLRVFRSKQDHLRSPDDDDAADVFRARWLKPIVTHAKAIVIATGIALALAVIAMRSVRFDYDLMALLPRGVDSVRWQQRLANHSDHSIWSAVSIADSLDEAAERTRQFRALDTVADVGGIGLLAPDNAAEKRELTAEARQPLETALAHATNLNRRPSDNVAASVESLREQVQALRRQINAAQLMTFSAPILQEALTQVTLPCRGILSFLDRNNEVARAESVRLLNSHFRSTQYAAARRLDAMLDPTPLTPNDFPPELLHEAIDRSNPDSPRYALYIYPSVTGDNPAASPLSDAFLPGFIADLRTVDPEVTGTVVQIYESGDLIQRSFIHIGIIALAAVFILACILFRSIIDALLALAPVAVGFAFTFGLMGLIGVNLNPANIIVLPLMFGIGVDAGIHILHRVRADPHDRPLGLAHGTGKAITLTALTTMIGFASMMIARHRGIASLGLVMTVGLGLTLLACWIVMPALLELRARFHHRGRTVS